MSAIPPFIASAGLRALAASVGLNAFIQFMGSKKEQQTPQEQALSVLTSVGTSVAAAAVLGPEAPLVAQFALSAGLGEAANQALDLRSPTKLALDTLANTTQAAVNPPVVPAQPQAKSAQDQKKAGRNKLLGVALSAVGGAHP